MLVLLWNCDFRGPIIVLLILDAAIFLRKIVKLQGNWKHLTTKFIPLKNG